MSAEEGSGGKRGKKGKRRTIPEGYQIRKAQGRDEKDGVVRIELSFSFEEWDRIEDRAFGKNVYPRQWLMGVIRKKIGSSSQE